MFRLFGKEKGAVNEADGMTVDPETSFLEDYETEEQELTVLIGEFIKGGAVRGDYLFPCVSFLAYIDDESGEAIHENGTLCWVIRRGTGNYMHDFKDYGIYRVLVRKMKPGVVNPLGIPFKNRYHIVKIKKKNVREPQLEQIREEYLKPVSIEDEVGTFQLRRRYGWFEGKIRWLDGEEEIRLDKDENGDTAEKALETLHILLSDVEGWDKKLREFAAAQLTELANDWQEDDTPEIGKEEFSQRIGRPTFHIDNKGGFEAEYGDDDMFYGHWIVVYGNADGELKRADIEG